MLQDATGGGTKGGEDSSLAMIVPPAVLLNSGQFTVSNNFQPPHQVLYKPLYFPAANKDETQLVWAGTKENHCANMRSPEVQCFFSILDTLHLSLGTGLII
jgi:hypothetical protein